MYCGCSSMQNYLICPYSNTVHEECLVGIILSYMMQYAAHQKWTAQSQYAIVFVMHSHAVMRIRMPSLTGVYNLTDWWWSTIFTCYCMVTTTFLHQHFCPLLILACQELLYIQVHICTLGTFGSVKVNCFPCSNSMQVTVVSTCCSHISTPPCKATFHLLSARTYYSECTAGIIILKLECCINWEGLATYCLV